MPSTRPSSWASIEPKVAILAATEMVNPEMPANMDAANLSKMAERGQIRGGFVDGPLALDNAISLKGRGDEGHQQPESLATPTS